MSHAAHPWRAHRTRPSTLNLSTVVAAVLPWACGAGEPAQTASTGPIAATVEVTYLLLDPTSDTCWHSVTEHRAAEHWDAWANECSADMALIVPTTDGTCVLLPHICPEGDSPYSDPWFDTCDNHPTCCDPELQALPWCGR